MADKRGHCKAIWREVTGVVSVVNKNGIGHNEICILFFGCFEIKKQQLLDKISAKEFFTVAANGKPFKQ